MATSGRASKLRKDLSFGAGVLAVFLVPAELLLRLFAPLLDPFADRIQPSFHRFLPHWNYFGTPPLEQIEHVGTLHGVEGEAVAIRVNRYGFIYPEERFERSGPDELRIAVLGGSTVEGVALQPEKRWHSVMERRLGDALAEADPTVLNLGISAQGTWTHLATVAQHAVDLDLDAMVLMLGANDLVRAQVGYRNMLFPRAYGESWPGYQFGQLVGWVATRSQLFRRLRRAVERGERGGVPYFEPSRREVAEAPLLDFEPHYSEEALDGYSRNLVSLAALGEAHGIEVVFTTQPMLWKADNSPEERSVFWLNRYLHEDVLYRLEPATAMQLLETLNRRLLRDCEEHGWHCIDVASSIPPSLDYFYDDLHFNDVGAELVGTVIAKALLRGWQEQEIRTSGGVGGPG